MVCACGIVLYNPDIQRLRENINAISGQCEYIYLFDNESANYAQILELIEEYSENRIVIERNSYNAGIATALNQLCQAANKDGFMWILTLDQDSVCPANMITEYNKYIEITNCAMLCPEIVDRNKKTSNVNHTEDIYDVNQCITSGSMLKISAWSEIGGFDERMFIDGVDFDMCHRIKKKGYRIIRVPTVQLFHELGKITERKFLFWRVSVKNHFAFRKYYIARNTIYLARKERNVLLLMKSFFQEVKLILIVIVYEDDKSNKIKRIICGIKDGIKMGIKKISL